MKHLLFAIALFVAPGLLLAGPMEISSARMVFEHQHEQAEFIEKVHLKRDDFELKCDRLIAFYKQNKLIRAEAFGHVRLFQQGVTGHAEKAILNQRENRLTLLGNAVLEQGGSRVTGDRIVHDLKREKTVIKPAKGGRTHMTIESEESSPLPTIKEKE